MRRVWERVWSQLSTFLDEYEDVYVSPAGKQRRRGAVCLRWKWLEDRRTTIRKHSVTANLWPLYWLPRPVLSVADRKQVLWEVCWSQTFRVEFLSLLVLLSVTHWGYCHLWCKPSALFTKYIANHTYVSVKTYFPIWPWQLCCQFLVMCNVNGM